MSNNNLFPSGHTLSPEFILHDNYIIDSVLGEGGFGITYSGTCMATKKQVAIKEFFPSGIATRIEQSGETFVSHFEGKLADSFQRGMHRFLNEANLLKEFQHLGSIVSVFDVFEANGTAYIVMEYIEGITLKQLILNEGALPFDEMLTLFKPVLLDLHEVHKRGLIHRDISPDNLIVGMDNHLHLIDFGAASFKNPNESKTMTVILKSGYAPPEQYISDGRIGAWTDVYGLCATMYMVLNGEKPIDAIRRMQNDSLDFIEGHSSLVDYQRKAILQGLRLNYAERFSSVKLLYQSLTTPPTEDLTQTVESFAVSAKTKMQIQSIGQSNSSKKFSTIQKIIILATLSIFIGFATWGIFSLFNQTLVTKKSKTDVSTEQSSKDSVENQDILTLSCNVDYLELTIGEEITYDTQFQLDYKIVGNCPSTAIAITETFPDSLLITESNSDASDGLYYATVYPYKKHGEGTLKTSIVDSKTGEIYATHSIPIKVNPPTDGIYSDFSEEILTMINVVGMTLSEAQSSLMQLDETIEVIITEEYSSEIPKGVIISQSIAANTQFTYKQITQIQLVVSKGLSPSTQAPKVSSGKTNNNNSKNDKSSTSSKEDGYTTIHLD